MARAPEADKSRLDWRASFARVEPVLQGAGFQYTFAILYALVNIVLFVHGAAPEWRKAVALRRGVASRLAICVARGSGALLNVNSAVVVLVAARRLMTFLRATVLNMVVPFDKAMPHFHTLVGHTLVVSGVAHVGGHAVNYSLNRLSSSGFHGYDSLLGTGVLLTAVLGAIRATVVPRLRRAKFEVFYYTHVVGFVLYYAFLVVHGAHNGVLSSWKFVIVPLFVYALDRVLRLHQENVERLEVAQSTAEIISGNVVCLRLPRAFHYKAGQYADIKVPAVSSVEWHPFTIASSPHESEMLFFIKRSGDWTNKLYDMLSKPPALESDDLNLQVHVRGPFGAPAQHVGQYEHVVLIGGGVGATPFASIAKYAHKWILDYTERGAREGLTANKSVSAALVHSQSVAHAHHSQNAPFDAAAAPTGITPPSSARNLFGDADLPPSGPQVVGRRLVRNVSSRLGRGGMGGGGNGSRQDLLRAAAPAPIMPPADPALDQGMYLPDRTQGQYPNVGRDDSRGDLRRGGSSGYLDRTQSFADSQQAFLTDSVGSNASDYPEGLGDPDAPLVSRRGSRGNGGGLYHSASSGGLYNSASTNGLYNSASTNGLYNSASGAGAGMYSSPSGGGLYNSASSTGAPFDDGPSSRRSYEGRPPNSRHQLEEVREYDSDQDLFMSDDDLDDDEAVEEEEEMYEAEARHNMQRVQSGQNIKGKRSRRRMGGRVSSRRGGAGRGASGSTPDGRGDGHVALSIPADDGHMCSGTDGALSEGVEYENLLLRDVPLESNAANLMGLSFGSTAMMRHAFADKKYGAEMRRASMNVMDEALDEAIWEERALFYLHTVTVNWFLLWIMFLRYAIAAVDGIVNGFEVTQKGLAVFSTPALIAIDLGLALLLAFPVNFAVALELRLHGVTAFFSESYGNVFDILLLVPISSGCVALSILSLIGIGSDIQHVSKVTLLLFWPTMSLLLLWRISRTVGSRITLAQYFKSTHSQTKSLDFIFASQFHKDDEWLVREMLPLTSSRVVRLHRYITKEEEGQPELWAQDYSHMPLHTTYRRPNFDEVFAGIAARSKSGSVIGVFYCCPGPMGRSIQQGAVRAMAKSLTKAYRCGYIESMGGERLEERNGGANAANLADSAAYGCAVRFALREENFG